MTINFLQPDVAPSPGTSRKTQAKRLIAEFGDGYSLPVPDGINSLKQEISLKWDLLLPDQALLLVKFFESKKACEPFFWIPSDRTTRAKWICEEWSDETLDSGFKTVSAKFKETFIGVGLSSISYDKGFASYQELKPFLKPNDKFLMCDFVNRGIASGDGISLTASAIEDFQSVVITRSTNGKIYTATKTIVNILANALRYHHDFNGIPQGVLFEGTLTYLNKYTQPTFAQVVTKANLQDAVTPAGETGAWVEPITDGVQCYAYQNVVALTNATPYCIEYEVWTANGLAPVVGQGAGSSFGPLLAGSYFCKNPLTGLAGANYIGPFTGGKWIVQCYFDAAVYSGVLYGWVRQAVSGGSHLIKMGRINIHAGRYPRSGFDNLTATPNTRSPDFFKIPTSDFRFDLGVTVGVDFTYAVGLPNNMRFLNVGNFTHRIDLYHNSSNNIYGQYYNGGVAVAFFIGNAIPGNRYRIVVAIDPVTLKLRGKLTATSPPTQATLASIGEGVIDNMFPAQFVNVGYQPNTNFFQTFMIQRAWSAAEIAAWTL